MYAQWPYHTTVVRESSPSSLSLTSLNAAIDVVRSRAACSRYPSIALLLPDCATTESARAWADRLLLHEYHHHHHRDVLKLTAPLLRYPSPKSCDRALRQRTSDSYSTRDRCCLVDHPQAVQVGLYTTGRTSIRTAQLVHPYTTDNLQRPAFSCSVNCNMSHGSIKVACIGINTVILHQAYDMRERQDTEAHYQCP